MRAFMAAISAAALVSACDGGQEAENQQVRSISVRSDEQRQLHELNELNRAIALRRAIRDSGYRCQRVERAGYVGPYENLEMWTATCDSRDWAIYIGPDGSAQVRLCEDVAELGLPACRITASEGGAGQLPQ